MIVGVGIIAVLLGGLGAWWWTANNVETPRYDIVREDGAIEIRDYPSMVAAEVVRSGGRWEAVNRGFGPLAGYIFAKQRPGETIAMTAPVTQERLEAAEDPVGPDPEGSWRVRFLMPAKYSLESLPEPAGSDIELKTLPAARYAAIRFSGVATNASLEAREGELRRWVQSQGLVVVGPASYAYYNDPFTPGFLRRNEVLLQVDATADGSTATDS